MFWKAAPIKSAKWLGLPQFPWGIGLSASIDVKLFGWPKNRKGQMATVMQKEISLRLTVTLHKKEGKYHEWLTEEFERRGWKLELQAPQVHAQLPLTVTQTLSIP